MKINEAGKELIKTFEGCRLTAYKDLVGVLTVGVGHTGNDVTEGLKIDPRTANALLDSDLAKFEAGVTKLVTAPLTDNQFSALVCFAYNVGLGNLKSSTLLKKVNNQDFTGAAAEFLRWNKAGGKEVPGLTRRRQAESDLFQRP